MSLLKNLDFFQKISVDNVTKPTTVGSILSVIAISLMTFLLLKEVYEFYTPTFVKDNIIYHDKDQDSKIHVNLKIQMTHMPCGLISVDQQDSIGNHRMDISDTLHKIRVGGDRKTVIANPVSSEIDDVNQAVKDNEGCKIVGFIDINKVPGNIHIAHHNYRQLWEYMRHVHGAKFNSLTLSHKIDGINFGDYKKLKKIFKRFGLTRHHEEFNRHDSLPTYTFDTKKNYDYFLKIIPYLFVDEVKGQEVLGYQYSLNFKEKEYHDSPGDQHIININYDFSPITMRMTRKAKYLSTFLTHSCAIVGGIFVMFSIINRIYLTCFDSDN